MPVFNSLKSWLAGRVLLCCFSLVSATTITAQEGITVIIRSDDMGFCHAVNEACMKVYKDGISRSVEILAPSPWFMETVNLLKDEPGYDVGVHLCLTSEWDNIRWRPLTNVPGLVDADGYFPKWIWKNNNKPDDDYLLKRTVNIEEVEKELRAQIELVKKYLPRVSHLSNHMGLNDANTEVGALIKRLAAEYGLFVGFPDEAKPIRGFGGFGKSPAQKAKELAGMLRALTPGVYYLVDHPGYDNAEMQKINQDNHQNVAYDRYGVTVAFTSPEVKKVINEKKIRLVSIKEAFTR